MWGKQLEHRNNYKVFKEITTRWMDNDVYGHVNNVTYYSYFDTAANSYLIEQGGLDIQNSTEIGYVVNSNCDYYSGIAYPDQIETGLRVDRLGNSSVQYGIAIFKRGEENPVAKGHFVHVFVNWDSGQSVSIPPKMRQALEKILLEP